jgi:flagellar motor switch protein FliG
MTDLAHRTSSGWELSSPQKAAAIMVAIGPERASKILAHMNEAEVELIANEIASLRSMPIEMLDTVVEELHEDAMAHRYMIEGGVDYARDLLTQWKGTRGDEIIERLEFASQTQPFDFLHDVEPEQLVQFISGEHPQTVAVVLSYVPSSYSARVLSGLDPDLRAEVSLRIALMDKISPEVIRRVEDSIKLRIGSVGTAELTHRGGIKELANILNSVDRTIERAVLQTLADHDSEMAENVRSLMFLFEDIVTIDDRDIQELLRTIEPRTLALAVKGVRQDVKDKVLKNLSDRARETLLEEIDVLGPAKLKDVEAAQSEVVSQIRKLDEEGKITMRRDAEGGFVE